MVLSNTAVQKHLGSLEAVMRGDIAVNSVPLEMNRIDANI